MTTILKKLPDVIGFYLPGDRRDDWTGEVLDRKTGELVKEPSMTKQSFVAECDINNIVHAFTATGQFTHVNEKAAQGAFVDLPDQSDFQEALELARAGQVAFMQLLAHLRARFENDPAQFLAFMANPENQEEMIKLGLATDTRPPPPPLPPAPPAAAAAPADGPKRGGGAAPRDDSKPA